MSEGLGFLKINGTPPLLDDIYWNSPYKHNLFWTFFESKKLPVDWNWHTCCVFYSGLEIIICICVHLYHAHSNIRMFLADALQLSMEGVQVWLGKDLLPQFTDKGVSMDETQGAGRTRGWVRRDCHCSVVDPKGLWGEGEICLRDRDLS